MGIIWLMDYSEFVETVANGWHEVCGYFDDYIDVANLLVQVLLVL